MTLSSSRFMAVHCWHQFWFSDTLLWFYKCSENHPLVFRGSVQSCCLLVSDFLQSTCSACLVAQLCLTLCDPMDCSVPGPSVHGDSPGKNTGVGCHAFLQGSSQARDRTQVSHVAGEFFPVWATREAIRGAILVSFMASLHPRSKTESMRLILK